MSDASLASLPTEILDAVLARLVLSSSSAFPDASQWDVRSAARLAASNRAWFSAVRARLDALLPLWAPGLAASFAEHCVERDYAVGRRAWAAMRRGTHSATAEDAPGADHDIPAPQYSLSLLVRFAVATRFRVRWAELSLEAFLLPSFHPPRQADPHRAPTLAMQLVRALVTALPLLPRPALHTDTYQPPIWTRAPWEEAAREDEFAALDALGTPVDSRPQWDACIIVEWPLRFCVPEGIGGDSHASDISLLAVVGISGRVRLANSWRTLPHAWLSFPPDPEHPDRLPSGTLDAARRLAAPLLDPFARGDLDASFLPRVHKAFRPRLTEYPDPSYQVFRLNCFPAAGAEALLFALEESARLVALSLLSHLIADAASRLAARFPLPSSVLIRSADSFPSPSPSRKPSARPHPALSRALRRVLPALVLTPPLSALLASPPYLSARTRRTALALSALSRAQHPPEEGWPERLCPRDGDPGEVRRRFHGFLSSLHSPGGPGVGTAEWPLFLLDRAAGVVEDAEAQLGEALRAAMHGQDGSGLVHVLERMRVY
ncbi:hypothetical protein DFJ74DRAFT_729160 [Hyaloraphidium curvatum]|nr:hypothetical protein DFJ74DRAFT_729160 [Hyaloraphidium curvatum]